MLGVSNSIHGFYSGIETRAKDCLIPNPIGLQRELDKVFNTEDRGDSDIIYRCAYWLIFSGINPSRIAEVKRSDVDFDIMTIHFNSSEYPIYRESINTIRSAATLDGFYYDHPIYGNSIIRERSDKEFLMAGIRSIPTPDMISLGVRNCSKQARDEEGADVKSLTLDRVYTSGIFYRMFENERAGFAPNFLDLAKQDTPNRNPANELEEYEIAKKVFSKAKKYKKEYDTWKKAFAV